jgi:hypothetical protein
MIIDEPTEPRSATSMIISTKWNGRNGSVLSSNGVRSSGGLDYRAETKVRSHRIA